MEFSLTYHNILDKNIRNIYSGRNTKPQYRACTDFQKPLCHSNMPARKQLIKSSEYIREHKCFIPKAQAFRCLPPQEVDAIVKRLRTSTEASAPRGKTSEQLTMEETEVATPRYMGLQTVTKEEHDAIVHNLGRPTHMSSLRERNKSMMPKVHN